MGPIGRIRPISLISLIGLIGLIGYIVWVPTLFFGLVYLDDNVVVGARDAFSAIAEVGGGYFYRPIPALSYMANAAVGGESPFGYHLVNILLHLVAGVLVYWLIRGLLEIGNRKQEIGQEIGDGKDEWVAAFGALIFLVHPVATQAVAWIPGRNEVLLAIFVLLSLISLMGHIRLMGRIRLIGLIGHFIFYALALFTKETAVVIIPIGLIGFMGQIRRIRPMGRMGLIGGWVAITVVWFLLRHNALDTADNSWQLLTTANAKNMVTVFLGSLGKLVFPFNLSTYPIVGESFLPMGLMGLISLIGLIGLIRLIGRMGLIGRIGLLWILLFTAASVIRPNIGDPQAEVLEHRLYLPLIGLVMFLGNWIEEIGDKLGNRKKERGHPLSYFHSLYHFPVSFFLFLFLLSAITFTNTRHYRDGMSYWKRAVATSPHSAFAHNQLGVMYYFDHDLTQAAGEYTKTLALNPQQPLAHNNLGVVYMEEGKLEEAKMEFERELEVNPGYENAIKNLEIVKNKVQ